MRTSSTLGAALLLLVACADASVMDLVPRPSAPPAAPPTPGCTAPEQAPGSAALVEFCVPPGWKPTQGLVVYAHGYVASEETLSIHDDVVAEDGSAGVSVSGLAASYGLAFATTSYRANGLVIREAQEDLAALVALFGQRYGTPQGPVYLVGASEGGLISALALEHDPSLYDGAVIACAPIGGFLEQVKFLGDFRALFDLLFPWVLPGNAVTPSTDDVRAHWEDVYAPRIVEALLANPPFSLALMSLTGASYDSDDLTTLGLTALGILWYSVFATGNAQKQLGGNVFDNTTTQYGGSGIDALDHWVDGNVERFAGDPNAMRTAQRYYTSDARFGQPVVTLHDILDPVVPYWHTVLFHDRAASAGRSALLTTQDELGLDLHRYGHCKFTLPEAKAAFSALRAAVTVSGNSGRSRSARPPP
jgi:pimeloyl-ACP methyl ester carboxylesterase